MGMSAGRGPDFFMMLCSAYKGGEGFLMFYERVFYNKKFML